MSYRIKISDYEHSIILRLLLDKHNELREKGQADQSKDIDGILLKFDSAPRIKCILNKDEERH